jgi:O-antigen ligase
LITAYDMTMAAAQAPQARLAPTALAVPMRERLLLVVLFVTVLASSVAFIEPSPHDALMGVLALACLIAGVRIERPLVIPLLLLLVWNVAGMMSLLNVSGDEKNIQYTATSVYLAVAALLFASLFAQNTMPRLAAMRAAYVLTAAVISLLGIAGYFQLFPGAGDLFAPSGRALGGFKDPNVFGPFLIWPALIVLERMVARHTRITDIVIIGILAFGLLLSFSRGAWFHFGVSCAIMLALTFLTAPTERARLRIFALSAIGIAALAAFVAVLLSFESISTMFQERAQLIQYYDVGQGGRFLLQELALGAVLNFPNGMGPFEFAKVYGLQQHNQYLQAFLVYGWAGGMAYVLLLLSTIWMACRAVMVRTPWQPYLIVAFATFVGEVLEGFVIDTDHWRHFFLLLGMIWGLAAATLRETQRGQSLQLHGQAWHVGAA